MFKEILVGVAGFAVGRQTVPTVTANPDLELATREELLITISGLQAQLIAKQSEILSLSSNATAAVAALDSEILTLETEIARLQVLLNADDSILFSRSIPYLGGIERGITNEAGQIKLAGSTVIDAPIFMERVNPSNTSGRYNSFQGALLSSVELKSIHNPTGVARSVGVGNSRLLAFRATLPQLELGEIAYLMIEFDPASDLSYFKSPYKCSVSRTVLWPRPNVCLIPHLSTGVLAAGFFFSPAEPIFVETAQFVGDFYTVGQPLTDISITVKRASVVKFALPTDSDTPTGVITPEGRCYLTGVGPTENLQYISTTTTTAIDFVYNQNKLLGLTNTLTQNMLVNYY